MSKILITARVNPDLDGTASVLADAFILKKQGTDAEGILFGELQPETLYFTENHGIKITTRADNGQGEWKQFVLVDASSMTGMPKVVTAGGVIEIIDHREPVGESEFPEAKIQNELVGAAATLVWGRSEQACIKLPQELALLLYGAIFHNSLNLQSSNTTERDKKAVKSMEKDYGFARQVIREMFEFSTEKTIAELEWTITKDMKEFNNFGAAQLVITHAKGNLTPKEAAISRLLETYRQQRHLKFVFLTTVDINTNENLIFCGSPNGQDVISRALGVAFANNWAQRSPALLRKQIAPLITTGHKVRP